MDSKEYKVNKANAYNGWDPLKQVILGNVFEPEFFEDIADHKLRDLMQQILYETHEDLDNIQKTLEDLDVEVIRMPANNVSPLGTRRGEYTNFNEFAAIEHAHHDGRLKIIPKPCLMPRDDFITLGDKILYTDHMWNDDIDYTNEIFNPEVLDLVFEDSWKKAQKQRWKPSGPLKPTGKTSAFVNDSGIMKEWGFWAPAVHRVGNRLIVDQEDWSNLAEFLLDRYPQFISANIAVGGHTDGSMNLPRPGLIVCGDWLDADTFKDTLPGWEVVQIKHPKIMTGGEGLHDRSELLDWGQEKSLTKGRWWHPEAKSNPDLVKFVDMWCNDWVGKAEETLFEVNMLAVNPEVSLSLNYQFEVHNALANHGVEAIYCRFRHRNFWDGGLHCLTLDTYREGGMQDYFA